MSSFLVVLRDLSAWFSIFDTAHLTDLSSKTGYRTLTRLKCLAICVFIMPAVSIPITILRLHNVGSGRLHIMKNYNFNPVYLFWYMYESVNANFDDMECTWNAGHVICVIFSTSRGKPWT